MYISTDGYAKKIYEKYISNENINTILLNGKWGSGKTTFILEVLGYAKQSTGIPNKNSKGNFDAENQRINEFDTKIPSHVRSFRSTREDKYKVKILDLWRRAGSDDLEMVIRVLFPVRHCIYKFFYQIITFILSVVIIMTQYYSSANPSKENSNENVVRYLIFLGLASAFNVMHLKRDVNSMYTNMLKYHRCYVKRDELRIIGWFIKFVKEKIVKKKIILIDDFDRLSSTTQELMYQVFHLLEDKKIQFIFLADYNNLRASGSAYLQKIIKHQIELSPDLHSSKIWEDLCSELLDEVMQKRSHELVRTEEIDIRIVFQLAVSENRTMRELLEYRRLISEQLFGTSTSTQVVMEAKIDKVVISELLLILYFYLFHNDIYARIIALVNDINKIITEIEIGNSFNENDDKEERKKNRVKTFIEDMIDFNSITSPIVTELIVSLFLEKREHYYDRFKNKPRLYTVNYTPDYFGSNATIKLLDEGDFERVEEYSEEDLDQLNKNLKMLRLTHDEFLISSALDLFLFIIEQELNYKTFEKGDVYIQYSSIANTIITIYSEYLRSSEVMRIMATDSKFSGLDHSQKLMIIYRYFYKSFDEVRTSEFTLQLTLEDIDEILNCVHPSILLAYNIQDFIKDIAYVKAAIGLEDREFLCFLEYRGMEIEKDNIQLRVRGLIEDGEVNKLIKSRFLKIEATELCYDITQNR